VADSVAHDVAGILLAAGAGSRLGQPKALVMLGGQSLARRGIAMLLAGGADPVVVVTGAAGPGQLGPQPADGAPADGSPGDLAPDDVAPDAVRPGDVSTVHNPDWGTGMGSSLAAGLAAVPEDCTAAVIALADQPLVGSAAVSRLIAAHAAGAVVAVACYDGRPRNPVLISREYWPEVAALAAGDVGARPFLRAHPELVTQIECGDTGRPDDLDTPDDLARVERLLAERPRSGHGS
jgi:CTP:molybdopterin cytidylyltransferase MocA